MAVSHAIAALKRKRAVMSGEILKAERRCAAMRAHLVALDTTLRLRGYDGDPAAIKPVRPPRATFRRGELQRAVLDTLRAADGPISNREIAGGIIAAKGWDGADVALARTVAYKVGDVRRRLPA